MDMMAKASQISETVEENIVDLIGKLCETEPREVRCMVWTMVAQRIAMLSGYGDCFQLPALDEC